MNLGIPLEAHIGSVLSGIHHAFGYNFQTTCGSKFGLTSGSLSDISFGGIHWIDWWWPEAPASAIAHRLTKGEAGHRNRTTTRYGKRYSRWVKRGRRTPRQK